MDVSPGLPRLLATPLRQALGSSPVVVLTGSRQTGKSTLARQGRIGAGRTYRRLMRAACLRLGNLVNQTELGRDVGMPQATVSRHLDPLEVSHLLVRLPAFAANRTSRLIKTPKLYWNDTALALHLAGEHEPRGAHLENLVLGDLLAWSAAKLDAPQVMYWRTASGREVDFVVEWKGRLLPVEVKATPRPRSGDADGLRAFRDEYREAARAGLLLHTGERVFWLADRVLAAPWWTVL